MRREARIAAFGLLVMGCVTTSAVAGRNDTAAAGASPCLRSGYEQYVFDSPVAIPDGDPAGITLGPLHTALDGHSIGDVVLAVDISHPYTGDIELRLGYDANLDGRPEISLPVELYRARTDGCAASEPAAYPDVLEGVYFFRDGGPGSPVTRDASGARVTPDANAEPGELSFFALEGLPEGGDFYLTVIDNTPEESGQVLDWGVLLRRTVMSEQAGLGEAIALQ